MRQRFVALVAFGVTLCTVAGAGAVDRERQIMASYLYNILKFVSFPDERFAGPDDPLVLAILGEDVFGDLLEKIEGKKVGDRTLTILRTESIDEIASSHIVFVSASASERAPEILQLAREKKLVTVSELDDFVEAGGTFGFFKEKNKLKYKLNEAAARHAGLKVSSRLVKAGTIYKG